MSQGRWRAGGGSLLAMLLAASANQAWSADQAAPAGDTPKTEAWGQAEQDKAQAAMERGLAWLRTHQKDNGAWSDENYPAVTALGLWAAVRSGKADGARRQDLSVSGARVPLPPVADVQTQAADEPAREAVGGSRRKAGRSPGDVHPARQSAASCHSPTLRAPGNSC